jgi:hypothetical protein
MYYVVLQVDSEEAARQLIEENKQDDTPDSEATLVSIGLFRAPTKFCDPSDGHRGKKTEAGWTRGKKYGWWVCGKCKKPTSQWASSLNAVLGAARNLLEGS